MMSRINDLSATPVIDIDPDLLERSADAARFAADQAEAHMAGETTCLDEHGVPALLETLTPHGPWAWAIMPQLDADGTVRMPIATTKEEIAACYRQTRGASNALGFEPLVELRGAWYTFQEGISRSYTPSTGGFGETETIILFPVSSEGGITGELAWWRMPRLITPGAGAGARADAADDLSHAASLAARRRAHAVHDQYLQALADGDPTALRAVFDADARSAVRDYVRDTGTLVALDGVDAQVEHLEQLLARVDLTSVELLERVVQDWFVFAEMRVTAVLRWGANDGERVGFNVAEILIPGPSGRFVARIGHGTDLAPLRSPASSGRPGLPAARTNPALLVEQAGVDARPRASTGELEVTGVHPQYGATITGIDLGGPVDEATTGELRRLFDRRGALVFPGQHLDHGAQDRLCRALLGDEATTPAATERFISNRSPEGLAPYGRLLFHADMMWAPEPFQVLSLYAVDVEPGAATTTITSGVRAWVTLPPALKERVLGLHAEHVTGQVYHRGGDDLLRPQREVERSTVTPIARRHPRTGETILYVSQQMTRRIVELDEDESEELLQLLFAHLYGPDLTYEHTWRLGDLLVLDNLAMQHSRGNVEVDGPARTLRKVIAPVPTIEAERPTFASQG
jgi:alpha-ketoglutarate-dependent taurine dioxygenase